MRFTYRLRPGATARGALLAEWGRCRWLWNEAVHQQKTGRRPTFRTLSKLLTEARARLSWLREGSQVAQQQTLRTYALALQHSYKITRRGRPAFKPRSKTLPSLEYTLRGFTIRDRRLRLAGGITIPVVWSRELPSDPTSVRVYQDSLGHWYASFVVRRDTAPTPAPAAETAIGVDWGVTVTATTTDPAYDLPHLGHRRRCAAELARMQRRMSRRRRPRGNPPSKGYLRARRQAAKLHRKAARQNTHDARQWAKRVVADHAVIAVEDFRPRFLARSTMARKVADVAVGAAKRELIDLGVRAGRKVVLVAPAYTTMTCSQCGTRAKERLGLGIRTFRCGDCGYTACRDRNAARTILATVERDRAGADDVRHVITSLRAGGGVRSEPEIPRLPTVGKR
ncbi:RNA-guided endonuclease InsQ/TnpB family protein [Micromonospora rosaria]|uniref:RNA-guided endonuclease InsQ/TnpB family protein n=1 Tax=Micromonospora rosaria TaxID=47874 RepID=UPI000A728DE2|nr:transposase [Micromonospora rosaria]